MSLNRFEYFLDLSNDIKLNIMSFLSKRDVGALLCTSKAHAKLKQSPSFWRNAILRDFNTHAPKDVSTNKYYSCMLEKEKVLTIVMASQCCYVFPHVIPFERNQESQKIFDDFKNTVEDFKNENYIYELSIKLINVFQSSVKDGFQIINDLKCSLGKLYDAFLLSSPKQMIETIAYLNSKNSTSDCFSDDNLVYITGILEWVGRLGMVHTLEIMLNTYEQLERESQERMYELIISVIYSNIAQHAQVESLQLVLDRKFDVNQIIVNTLWCFETFSLDNIIKQETTLLAWLLAGLYSYTKLLVKDGLSSESEHLVSRLDRFKSSIVMLLANGVDVDACSHSVDPDVNQIERRQNLNLTPARQQASEYLKRLEENNNIEESLTLVFKPIFLMIVNASKMDDKINLSSFGSPRV